MGVVQKTIIASFPGALKRECENCSSSSPRYPKQTPERREMGHRMGGWKQISNQLNSLAKSGLKFHKSRVDKGLSKQNIPSSLTGNFENTLKKMMFVGLQKLLSQEIWD